MLNLPKFKAAAVQASPVYLNVDATIDKACALIAEAARNGAQLVAFPEVFVPGYPYWNWLMTPVQGSPWFEKLCRNSITVPGPEVDRLCEAARRHNCTVVIGVNERNARSVATLYNTNLIISDQGELIGAHRKLVPTWAEKLTWAGGDGSSLKVYDTSVGPLGTLACGENTNTLARFTLLAEGELVHIANYISLPVAPADYNMADAIRIRAAAHSFEGKVFTVVSCSTISPEIIDEMSRINPESRQLLARKNSAFSGIIGPDGNAIGKTLVDEEGIVYADIDLNTCIQAKQMHDIIGSYNRFDIFNLKVNRQPQSAVSFETQEVFTDQIPAKLGHGQVKEEENQS
jgi:nitrilase